MFDKTDYVSQAAAALAQNSVINAKTSQGPILSALDRANSLLAETRLSIEALESRLNPALGQLIPEQPSAKALTPGPESPLHAALLDLALRIEESNYHLRTLLDRLTL